MLSMADLEGDRGVLPVSFLEREDSHHKGCSYVKGPLYGKYCPGDREKTINNGYKTSTATLSTTLCSSPCHRCPDIALKSYSFGANNADAAPGPVYHKELANSFNSDTEALKNDLSLTPLQLSRKPH